MTNKNIKTGLQLLALRREETSELSTQVQQLVARLMDRDQDVEETFNRLEHRINRHRVVIDREETRVRSICHKSSLSLIVLFQCESLSELVYSQQTQILALRDRQDVVDLTLDSDSEDSKTPLESIVKIARPTLRNSDQSLVLIEEGHSVGRQCCVRSLGRIKQTTPYGIATGVYCDRGSLQLLESGSRSDSSSSRG